MRSIPDYVQQYLDAHNTLSLATTNGARSWAASVFYATDAGLNFYFVSDPKTRHCLDMAGDALIAATINDDSASWSEIVGVQLSGSAGPVSASQRKDIEGLYLAKFKKIRDFMKAPETDQEKLIAARLRAAQFYQITPQWLRYIDNSRVFGHKEEFLLSAS